jgi:hypothetical protein
MFPHERPHEALRLRGPSRGTTSERRKSHPHEGNEHLLRL